MPVVAIPAAIVVIVGLLAIALLLAWEQFAKVISNIVPSWHIPGLGSLRGWITAHLREGYNAVAGYLDTYVHGVVHLITNPIALAKALLDMIVSGQVAVHLALYKLFRLTVPAALSVAKRYALALASALQAQALSYYRQSLAWATAKVAALQALALGWYHSALAYALDLANAVQSQAVSLFHLSERELAALGAAERAALAAATALEHRYATDLANYVQGQAVSLFKLAEADVVRAEAAAAAFAKAVAATEAAAAVRALNGLLVTDLHVTWPAVVAGIDGVIDVAAGDFADIVTDLKAISRDIPTSIPGAVATVGALAIPLLRLARDCTMPNCRNLSQVGRDLQALFGLVETGAFLALLGDAARDPQGFAHELHAVLSPIVDGAMTIAKAETGAP